MEEADTNEEEPAEEEEAPADDGEIITLHFLQYSPEYTDQMNAMAEEYAKVNPKSGLSLKSSRQTTTWFSRAA